MTNSAKAPARRLAAKIALVGVLAALPVGVVAAPAVATNLGGSCNIDGNVKAVKDCPAAE
ncbi:hypothetical protein ACWF62_01835 [Rhodococcus sp. NPDC054953]